MIRSIRYQLVFLICIVSTSLCHITGQQNFSEDTVSIDGYHALESILEGHLKAKNHYDADTLKTTVTLYNQSKDTIRSAVRFSNAELMFLEQYVDNEKTTYFAGAYHDRSKISSRFSHNHFYIALPPQQVSQLKFSGHNKYPKKPLFDFHQSTPEANNTYVVDFFKNKRGASYINGFFMVALFVQFLFFFLLNVFTPSKEYLFYSLYILMAILHYSLTIDTSLKTAFVFPSNPILNAKWNDATLNLMYIMYVVFIWHYLEFNKQNRILRLYSKGQIALQLIVGLIITAAFLRTDNHHWIQTKLYGLYTITFVFFLVSIYLIIRYVKGNLKYFIVIGAFFLALFSLLELLVDISVFPKLQSWIIEHGFFNYNITQLGILLELSFFSLGLGYKVNQVYQEKDNAQQELILQLQENQQLQQSYTEELSKEVTIRSKELMEEKEKLLQVGFEKRITELQSEMRLAQMNPHFIFNNLNAIKYTSLAKSKEETAAYITEFSELIRTILINSTKEVIVLQEEIEFIRLYLDIESRRHQGRFTYAIDVDKTLSLEEIAFPRMILQPLIENSILHGILPGETIGHIQIDIINKLDHLLVVVDDNGIGRVAARRLAHKKEGASLATTITKERIQLLNKLDKRKIMMNTIDKKDAEGQSTGTRVEIKLYEGVQD